MASIIKAINDNCFLNEVTQLTFSFAWGLSTGQWFLTPGWYVIYIIVFQVFVWKLTEYYPPRQRGIMYLAINMASFIGQIIGNLIINNMTGLENFIYRVKHDKDMRTKFNKIADSFINWLDSITRSKADHERILQTLDCY